VQTAQKGDAIALASSLAHEAYHVARGSGQKRRRRPEQVPVLCALGAKKRDIVDVERAATPFKD